MNPLLQRNRPIYGPTAGLVLWLPMRGNALDATPNGFNGTVTGASLAVDRLGRDSYAYSFDGSSNYVLNNNSPVSAYPFTICCWVAVTNLNNSSSVIFGIQSSSGSNWGEYWLQSDSGLLSMRARDFTNRVLYFKTTPKVTSGRWYHMAGVFNSPTSRQIFVDGVGSTVQTTSTEAYGTNATPNKWVLGANRDIVGQYFGGSIADARIYNRALTTGEILILAKIRPVGASGVYP